MGNSLLSWRQMNVGLGEACARHVSFPSSPVSLAARSKVDELAISGATGRWEGEWVLLLLLFYLPSSQLTSDYEQHIAIGGIGHMIVGHTTKVAHIGALRFRDVQI